MRRLRLQLGPRCENRTHSPTSAIPVTIFSGVTNQVAGEPPGALLFSRLPEPPPAAPRLVRTFIAVVPPRPLIEKIYSETSLLRAPPDQTARLRWVRADNFHLTLNFLGAIEASRIEHLKRALAQAVVGMEPFEVEMSRIGVFPSWHAPRVLHVEASRGTDELASLSRRVWDALRDARPRGEDDDDCPDGAGDGEEFRDLGPERPVLKRKREVEQEEVKEGTQQRSDGWPEEPRQAFVPHLTLARWRRERNNKGHRREGRRPQPNDEDQRIRALAQTWQERLSFQVNELYLMESVLPGGLNETNEVQYLPLHVQPLDATTIS